MSLFQDRVTFRNCNLTMSHEKQARSLQMETQTRLQKYYYAVPRKVFKDKFHDV